MPNKFFGTTPLRIEIAILKSMGKNNVFVLNTSFEHEILQLFKLKLSL